MSLVKRLELRLNDLLDKNGDEEEIKRVRQELADAEARARNQREAWNACHPKMGSLWPKS